MVINVTNLYYRQGTSIARGTTIDAYLDEKDCDILYQRWKLEWPEPFSFSGGVKAITAEMILDVPEQEFTKAFGKVRAVRIRNIAKRQV